MEELTKYIKALVFLKLEEQTGTVFNKPELLLSRAGLSNKEIGELLGKKPSAVAMAISRAKKAQAEGSDDNE